LTLGETGGCEYDQSGRPQRARDQWPARLPGLRELPCVLIHCHDAPASPPLMREPGRKKERRAASQATSGIARRDRNGTRTRPNHKDALWRVCARPIRLRDGLAGRSRGNSRSSERDPPIIAVLGGGGCGPGPSEECCAHARAARHPVATAGLHDPPSGPNFSVSGGRLSQLRRSSERHSHSCECCA